MFGNSDDFFVVPNLDVVPDVGTVIGPDFVQLPCFSAGTLIETARGMVAVEALAVGDRIMTRDGSLRPVVWLGHRRVDIARHPKPAAVTPIRVRVGAFGPGLPTRDLFLSPDHAIAVEGGLIPVRLLVNGGSVAPVAMDAVTYWHVELDAHAVIYAEGLAVESFLDSGNRASFANAGVVALAPFLPADPHAAARAWETRGCAPLILHGPALARARALLAARDEAPRAAA